VFLGGRIADIGIPPLIGLTLLFAIN